MVDREHARSHSFIAGRNVILEQVATGAPLNVVLAKLVRLIEDHADGMLCSVLLVDEDRLHLRHGAAPSLPESYVKAIDGIAIGPSSGSCGTAAYLGTPVVVTDILTDPLWDNYRELGVRHGLRACWSTPILSPRGELSGTFAVYYRIARRPLPEEELLIQVATHMASIAIEHWSAQDSVRKSEERYRALVFASSQDVWRTNERGEAFFVTAAWAEMTGQTPDEIKGFGWLDSVHPEDRQRCIAAWKRAELESCWYENEFRVRTRDGTYRTFHCRGVPILRDDGSIREWVGANTDITEKKMAEEALHQRERDLNASNGKIRELARKLIAAQEEERRHISRELHDDLNQQVAVLSIMLSNMKREVPPEAESLRSKLEKVQNYAVEITENIRRLSHELHPQALEHVGLASALRKYVTDFSRIHGIEIGFTLADGTIPQDAAVCLYRIAQESLSNVVRHSGAKTAEVTLSIDNSGVHLDVADSGCGFDLDTARKNGGLGLASMEERIRLVNGNLTISTHPGSGSKFHATIPLQQVAVLESRSSGRT